MRLRSCDVARLDCAASTTPALSAAAGAPSSMTLASSATLLSRPFSRPSMTITSKVPRSASALVPDMGKAVVRDSSKPNLRAKGNNRAMCALASSAPQAPAFRGLAHSSKAASRVSLSFFAAANATSPCAWAACAVAKLASSERTALAASVSSACLAWDTSCRESRVAAASVTFTSSPLRFSSTSVTAASALAAASCNFARTLTMTSSIHCTARCWTS
mmetsp:Transcript_79784/g.171025  ORF Transcript_79784/g.171025 Transcript_79784/m.171025 type:complete len:218 (+) Transcript_79784:434-1087(+)